MFKISISNILKAILLQCDRKQVMQVIFLLHAFIIWIFKSEYSEILPWFAYIYSNCSKWPPSESIMQRAARFLLCRTIFIKLFYRYSLQICWRVDGDHICSWASSSSDIAYIGSKKNSPVVKRLANMVANDVACCERWFGPQTSIAKMTNIVQ